MATTTQLAEVHARLRRSRLEAFGGAGTFITEALVLILIGVGAWLWAELQ